MFCGFAFCVLCLVVVCAVFGAAATNITVVVPLLCSSSEYVYLACFVCLVRCFVHAVHCFCLGRVGVCVVCVGVCWCLMFCLGLVLSVGFVRACSGFGACLPPWCMYESVVCSVCVDSFPVCAVCLMCSGIRVYLLSRCVHLRCMYVRACVLRVYPVFVPVGVRFICCHE